MMDVETWLMAEDAVEAGLVDRVGGQPAEAAPAPANRFKNLPGDLDTKPAPPQFSNKPKGRKDAARVARKLRLLQLKCKFR